MLMSDGLKIRRVVGYVRRFDDELANVILVEVEFGPSATPQGNPDNFIYCSLGRPSQQMRNLTEQSWGIGNEWTISQRFRQNPNHASTSYIMYRLKSDSTGDSITFWNSQTNYRPEIVIHQDVSTYKQYWYPMMFYVDQWRCPGRC